MGNYRADTRRVRHGKMIGHNHRESYGRSSGKYLKSVYWQAERNYWKRYACTAVAVGDTDNEVSVRMGSLLGAYSELGWKGW